jgi:hypothetical protein
MFKYQLIKNLIYVWIYFLLLSCSDFKYSFFLKKSFFNNQLNFSTTFSSSSTTLVEENNQDEIPFREVINLYAPRFALSQINGINIIKGAPFVKFSFTQGENGSIVETDSENWDLAFRGKTIILNGGNSNKDNVLRTKKVKALLLDQAFEEVINIPEESKFHQDNNESYVLGTNWYTYSIEALLAIIPKEITIIIKTHDHKYVKMKIRSYYRYETRLSAKNSLLREPGYYTFEFKIAQDNKFERVAENL